MYSIILTISQLDSDDGVGASKQKRKKRYSVLSHSVSGLG